MTRKKIILIHISMFLLSSIVFALYSRVLLDLILSGKYYFGTHVEFVLFELLFLLIAYTVSCFVYLRKGKEEKRPKFIAIKFLIIILIISLIPVFFLKPKQDSVTIENLKFNDRKLDFDGSIFHIDSSKEILEYIDGIKFSGVYKEHDWFRKKENLLLLHSCLKKVGYTNIITASQLRKKIVYSNKHWGNITFHGLLDTLVLTGRDKSLTDSNYFKKFWERRKNEGNDNVLFDILKEIQEIYYLGKTKPLSYVEGQSMLYELIYHNVELLNTYNKESIVNYFSFLESMQLNFSAYKFILNQDRLSNNIKDSLVLTLPTVEEKEFKNRSSWIKHYYDGGP